MSSAPPHRAAAEWARALAEGERDADTRARVSRERTIQSRQQFAQAAAAMLSRLHALFSSAAAAFNAGTSSRPVDVATLKGTGFVVSRDTRRLTVLKTSDWNVVFSFSSPPKIDYFALLSRLEGDGVGWRLYRKPGDSDKLEPAPREPGELADVVVRQLFSRIVQSGRLGRR